MLLNFPVSSYILTKTSTLTQINFILIFLVMLFILFNPRTIIHSQYYFIKKIIISSVIFWFVIILPLLHFNVEFFRIVRNFLPLIYSYFYLSLINTITPRFFYRLFFLIPFALYLFWYKIIFTGFNSVFLPLFDESNNLIFNFL